MEPLFEFCVDDLNVLLPQMKSRLMSGMGSTQVIEQILKFLRNSTEPNRDIIVEKLVRCDIIPVICDAMQTWDENFVKVVLEYFDLISAHRGFYENYAAVDAVQSMLRLSYYVNKSLKNSMLFEKLMQSICNILVRSSELAVNIDSACVPQQIIFFVKDLDIKDSQKSKIVFIAVTMLNVILQQIVFDENTDDEDTIIDVCRDALKSMADFVKYAVDDNTILHAVVVLCGTCAGVSRYCNVNFELENQTNDKLEIYHKKAELSIYVYDTMMEIIIPYVKNADLSRVDSIKFNKDLVSCLNNLYQLKNCNHDDLSNHLTMNSYLKYFLCLTVQLPDQLRKNICVLLSRILSILGKAAFPEDTIKFANILHQGLLDLPTNSVDQWNHAIKHHEKNGTALMILLYYHFHGTREYDMVSLELLVARVMLLPRSEPISVLILKPLWLLFAATSISNPHPNSIIHNYENAVARLIDILQRLEISEFYTHHIDLLHHWLKCPNVPPNLTNQILDLWLIESDGDIKPLLPFDCGKVVRHLLVIVQIGYPQRVMSLAVKGLCHLIEIGKDDRQRRYTELIEDIVWNTLPNILSSHESNTVEHIEAVLKLANITQPHTLSIHVIMRTAFSVVKIMLKKNADSKFMTLIITQAYVLLVAATSRKSFKVLQLYVEEPTLLQKLYMYGFSQDGSELTTISIKLLAFIIHCQKTSPIKCKRPLKIRVKSLVKLLTYARKSPCYATNVMQFICELLTQNFDGSVVVLRKIATNTDDKSMIINLYEILHIIHVQSHPMQRDDVYQCLTALLHFCNTQISTLVPHLCTVMSNYDLIFNVTNTRDVSCHFVEFVVTWLRYRKATCNYVPRNIRSLYKTAFDEVLGHLEEYCAIVNDEGLKDAYLNLRYVLSQFK